MRRKKEKSKRIGGKRATVDAVLHGVIHGVLFSPPSTFGFIANGIDSLDLNLFVTWRDIQDLYNNLRHAIAHSSKYKFLWRQTCLGSCRLYCHCDKRHYRFHLKVADFEIYIGSPIYRGYHPNVFISFHSTSLWHFGVTKSIVRAKQFVEELGGSIDRTTVNRLDLCADFFIPEGLTLNFLLSHRVTRARSVDFHLDGKNTLETLEIGKRKALCCRIYNKSRELKAHSKNYSSYAAIDPQFENCIWRLEFEFRRKALLEFGISTPDDLLSNVAGLWSYATRKWLTLRVPSKKISTRRLIHPLWTSVQACTEKFGYVLSLTRKKYAYLRQTDYRRYTSQIAGFLPGLAVLLDKTTVSEVLKCLPNILDAHWEGRDFESARRGKALDWGISLNEYGDDTSKPDTPEQQEGRQ